MRIGSEKYAVTIEFKLTEVTHDYSSQRNDSAISSPANKLIILRAYLEKIDICNWLFYERVCTMPIESSLINVPIQCYRNSIRLRL